MTTELLQSFCRLHATPGDEGEVFDALLEAWQRQGLRTRRVGAYAVLAEPAERTAKQTVLLIAHADSPGFIVSSIASPTEIEVLVLGGIHPIEADLTLKTSRQRVPAKLVAPGEDWTRSQPLTVRLSAPVPEVQKGDRLCWTPSWQDAEGLLTSPFLDNRIGCALIAEWAEHFADLLPDVNVVLAASAMEEVNGFGANVLANAVQADAVIALDVTYENEKQQVKMGEGPVITLSDASVLLSPTLRDRLQTCGVPLQTEVYNYSGTDARAFPAQGIPTPVVPVLLATRGNHSPQETIAKADLETWPAAIAAVAHTLLEP